ncbi:MAG: glutamate ligase domain-containing protein, partial [Acidimicrobiales bacterium]
RVGGRFNVLNALAAATAARGLAIPDEHIAAGLEAVASVRGRFEPVDMGQPFTVLVDYAHTPDGLAQALGAAREIARGRLLVVFGAGGERDQEKRPLMGEVTSRLADLAVVTSDNPRHEYPDAIIAQIVAGATHPERMTVQPDRRAAIATAVAAASAGDVVVIAGKGHEPGQDLGDRVVDFDDATEVRAALVRILAARGEHPRAEGPTDR